MKILVPGGSGFIGSRLVPELIERGHDVAVFDLVVNPALADITTVGDIRDEAAITAACDGFDAVINLAAAHRDDVRPIELYEQTNVDGARNLVAAMEANGITRLVFTSSVAVYGLDAGESTETDIPAPFNEYGRTKFAAEEIYRVWQKQTDATLSIVRPCVVFGEGNRGNVYNLAKQLASGLFMSVGNGKNRKSMAYVGNVVAFLADQVENAEGYDLTNYADKPDLTTNELTTVLRDALGKHRGQNIKLPLWIGLLGGYAFDALAFVTRRQLPISSVRIRKFAASTVVDSSKLEASGFVRPFSITEGLRRTVKAEFGAEL